MPPRPPPTWVEAVFACAKTKDAGEHGHIAAVVPEPNAPEEASRSNGSVTKPLVSQAGAQNFSYKASNFYRSDKYQAFGFWAHS
jgi:hypothetical protein